MNAADRSRRPVSVVTVAYDTFFFVRLLVEKVREFTRDRVYEIILVDRSSGDGTLDWARRQGDIRVISVPQNDATHGHGEAAEIGARAARFEVIALLDSDAHPVSADWLSCTADRLDAECRLAGPKSEARHRGNPYGWYIHPHFMVFFRSDLGGDIVLRKVRGEETDTGEEATIRLLDRGAKIEAFPLHFCPKLPTDAPDFCDFGHRDFPTVSAGVFHAWYGTRVEKDDAVVRQETDGNISRESYREPLVTMLRRKYRLNY